MSNERVIAVRTTKTVYRDQNKILKVFSAGYAKANVLNEALNQARAEETGLPVPSLLEVSTVDEKWTLVSEYIEGKTLARLMEEQPEKKAEYLERFVDIQMEIFHKKAPLMNKLIDKMTRKIILADLNPNTRYDLLTRLESMSRHDKICHGDYNPSNIVITPDNKAYILDWAHATQGNASADAAQTYLLFCLEDDQTTADEYLRLYCEKSGVTRQYVQRWLPLVAAAHLTESKPSARELLSRWIDVVDYE